MREITRGRHGGRQRRENRAEEKPESLAPQGIPAGRHWVDMGEELVFHRVLTPGPGISNLPEITVPLLRPQGNCPIPPKKGAAERSLVFLRKMGRSSLFKEGSNFKKIENFCPFDGAFMGYPTASELSFRVRYWD